MDHYCLVLDYKRFCNTVRIYDCIHENGVNKLCQITHMHFDFLTAASKPCKTVIKTRERRAIKKKDKREEGKKGLIFLSIFISSTLGRARILWHRFHKSRHIYDHANKASW